MVTLSSSTESSCQPRRDTGNLENGVGAYEQLAVGRKPPASLTQCEPGRPPPLARPLTVPSKPDESDGDGQASGGHVPRKASATRALASN